MLGAFLDVPSRAIILGDQLLSQFKGAFTENYVANELALILDPDNLYYLSGFWGYLGMDFGRPTILVVPRDGKSLLITPSIDAAAAKSAAQVDRISTWNGSMNHKFWLITPPPTSATPK